MFWRFAGVQRLPDLLFRRRQWRHRDQSDRGETDTEPARRRVMSADQILSRLDRDVGGEQQERCGDEPLCASLGAMGAHAPPVTSQSMTSPAAASITLSAPNPSNATDRATTPAAIVRAGFGRVPGQTQPRRLSRSARERSTLCPFVRDDGDERQRRQRSPGAHAGNGCPVRHPLGARPHPESTRCPPFRDW